MSRSRWVHEKVEGEEFLGSGYKIAAFPDSVDEKAPMIGYLPGLPMHFEKTLASIVRLGPLRLPREPSR